MEAKVILVKCPTSHKTYGIRVQKTEIGDWIKTWAFKINELSAVNAGYDRSGIIASLQETENYPGCPYCGVHNFYQCGSCGKIVCYNGIDSIVTCPWCGYSSGLTKVDSFNVDTSSF